MGQLCFGLIACRRAVPDVRDIAQQMKRAFDSFAQLPLPQQAAASLPKPAPAALPEPKPPPKKARPKLRVVAKVPVRTRSARAGRAAG